MHKLLLVEDDPQIISLLQSHLSDNYQITVSRSLNHTFELLSKNQFTVALVDRVLEDGDGLEVIEYLKDNHFQTKIIALSQLADPNNRITGLEVGADDYLAKPFSIAELKLKISKACLLQKMSQIDTLELSWGSLFPASGLIKINNKKIQVRKKEMQILQCLSRYKNRVVSREQLINEAWLLNENIPTQTTLDVYIRRLRVLLGKAGSNIKTKRGFGYQLNG